MFAKLGKILLVEDEREVLLALVTSLVDADDERSIEEIEALKQLGDALGREEFMVSARQARRRYPTRDSLQAAAATVERPEARDAIFSVLQDLSMRDGLVAQEAELLDWLSAAWQIDWRPESVDL